MSLAPLAAKNGFSYAGDSIYVEASGHNRHRRATIPELKAHFKGSSDVRDPPAHWYEAQLLHYGLPPSKTKGTAKMRLFEAVNKGNMTVPFHIQKLEADLKKEWMKNERELKKTLKQQAAPSPAAKGTKRKAEALVTSATNVNLNLSFSVTPSGAMQIQTAEQPKKKANTTGFAPDTKQTARRGGPASSGPTDGRSLAGLHSSPSASQTPMKNPIARRAGIQNSGRNTEYRNDFGATGGPYDGPPPPYTEFPDDGNAEADYYKEDGYHDDYSDVDRNMMHFEEDGGYGEDEEPLAPLGLLNGRYMIECSSLTTQQGPAGADAGLILTLDGDSLWGSFDFGGINGILLLPTRPWQSSHDGIPFMWRGEDNEGNTFRGDEHTGHIWFLGRGRIRGELLSDCSGWHDFHGDRVSGQETRSEISSWSMRRQWNELEW